MLAFTDLTNNNNKNNKRLSISEGAESQNMDHVLDSSGIPITRVVVRDFPVGCRWSKTRSATMLETLSQNDVLDREYDSDPEELLLHCDETVELNHKTDNFPEKYERILAKNYPPRRGISAIRSLPQGCRAKTQQINTEVFSTGTLGNEKPLVRETVKASGKNWQLKNVGSSCNNDVFQLDFDCWESNEAKVLNNDKGKSVDRMLSVELYRTKTVQGKDSIDKEVSSHRVIVQALMAASNCPWRRQRKRAIQGKPRSNTTQQKLKND